MMMIAFLLRAALAAVVLAASPLVASAQTQSPAPSPSTAVKPAKKADDPVVATINGAEIHRSEVEAARQDLPPQYQSFPFEIVFPALVERLVDGKLLVAEGRKEGLAEDAEVRERLARLEDQVIQGVYLNRAIKTKLSDELLKQRYQEFLKVNPPEPEIHARHILVKTEEEAKAAVKELKGGADFIGLAEKKSTGPSAGKGGDLGFIKRGDVVPEFAEAAFALKAGQYTETPVKTQFGWHVIKVEETRDAAPPSFEEAKPELERQASRDMITEIVNDLRGKAKIVRFNPDGSAKTDDGGTTNGTEQKGGTEPKKSP